jgi:hypothetical protein
VTRGVDGQEVRFLPSLPWWVWTWALVIVFVTVASAWDDLRENKPYWLIALGLTTGAACFLIVMAFFSGVLAERLGGWIPVLATIAVVGFTVEMVCGVRDLRPDPEFTDRENTVIKAIGIWLAVGIFLPAIGLGVYLAVDVLRNAI